MSSQIGKSARIGNRECGDGALTLGVQAQGQAPGQRSFAAYGLPGSVRYANL